ncbi:MAG: HNH endonuclease [Acidobacteriota bacterium]
MAKNLWTRDELIVTLNLYFKLPYGQLDHRTKEVIELANLLGRTPGAISIRLNNFANVDPYHQSRGVIGLANGRRQVEPIWNEFINNQSELLFEGERILAEYQHKNIEEKFSDILIGTKNLKGETKIRAIKTRVNQNIFRQIVLVNYSGKCAITKIDIPELLIASHIIPWSQNEDERLNPENGICLSPTFDKCFDKGFLGIDADYKIHLSPKIKEQNTKPYFEKTFSELEGRKIHLPLKYLPKREFLDYHFTNIFKS